jgi:alkyl hydroperoxide reductase subunit AhpC
VLLLLLLLLLLQFTDEHGEVCPANWTPGAATMKADPKESLVRPLGFWCGYKLNILV